VRVEGFLGVKSSQTLSVVAAVLALVAASCSNKPNANTATPIHHLVVIFQENVSFDHYFGTYPHAANIDGQPFTARGREPRQSMG
jgi:phospholipase C